MYKSAKVATPELWQHTSQIFYVPLYIRKLHSNTSTSCSPTHARSRLQADSQTYCTTAQAQAHAKPQRTLHPWIFDDLLANASHGKHGAQAANSNPQLLSQFGTDALPLVEQRFPEPALWRSVDWCSCHQGNLRLKSRPLNSRMPRQIYAGTDAS